jgi:hypothetical protein
MAGDAPLYHAALGRRSVVNYFREAAALAASSPPTIGKLMEIAARYGLTFHMERIPAVMAAHKVAL